MSHLMKPTYYKIYKKIVQMKTTNLAPYLYKILQKYYTNIITNEAYDYILAEGDIPIALVAHMDTIFEKPPEYIYYDPIEEVIWSPQGGIGDDRAGIFMILSLIFEGYRPTIIFTNDEELGGLGATQFIADYPKPPWNINFLIELDRHGVKDAVFYNCGNEAFAQYITNFGFDLSPGIFTDICIICPIWKIAGVNLSIGYINEHSIIETWYVEIAMDTIRKVTRILESDTIKYEYVENIKQQICNNCMTYKKESEIFPYILEDGTSGFICYDCAINKNLDWCEKCGKLFAGKGNRCRRCNMIDLSKIEI